MVELTEKTIKRLFALSGNNCAYPGCKIPIIESSGTVTGEICHIRARHAGGPRFDARQPDDDRNAFSNLLLLCRRHHKAIDSEPELYTVDALTKMKAIHESVSGRSETLQDTFFAKLLLNSFHRVSIDNNAGNIAINSPGSIQGKTINLKSVAKKISVTPPPGTIGADQDASRYVTHLIKRYNHYASSCPTRTTKFNHGAISKNIEYKFGAQWQFLPLERAQEIYEYLQKRISRTRIAKINEWHERPSFSTYEEYISKHEH